MKAMERLLKAINAVEEELDEIDRVLDPLRGDAGGARQDHGRPPQRCHRRRQD